MPPVALRGLSEVPPGRLLQRPENTYFVVMRVLMRTIKMKKRKKNYAYLFYTGLPKKRIKDRCVIRSHMCAYLKRRTSKPIKGKLSLTKKDSTIVQFDVSSVTHKGSMKYQNTENKKRARFHNNQGRRIDSLGPLQQFALDRQLIKIVAQDITHRFTN